MPLIAIKRSITSDRVLLHSFLIPDPATFGTKTNTITHPTRSDNNRPRSPDFWLGLITCWNFRDDDKILSNDEFKQLMQYLVQDVQESLDLSRPHYTSSPAIGIISQSLRELTAGSPPIAPTLAETGGLTVWLQGTAVHNAPKVRFLLTIYIVDLTTVLKSLFEITLERAQSPGKTTWLELKEAFERYENSGSRQRIHGEMFTILRKEQQVLDPNSFQGVFSKLVNEDANGRSPAPGPVPTTRPTPNPPPVPAPVSPSEPSGWRRKLCCA